MSLAWSNDSQLLAGGEQSVGGRVDPSRVKIWSAKTGALVASTKLPMNESGITHLEFSPDNKYLVSSGDAVRIWHTADLTQAADFSLDLEYPASFNPCRREIAVAGPTGVLIYKFL
jgi:WD40 repeat protein